MQRAALLNLAAMAAAIVAGIAAYLLLFATLVHKPLTLDIMGAYIDQKQRIMDATPSPRILILAGSNGRFSHSCEQIARDTGIACANLSTTASIGLKYQIDAYIDRMRPGDLLYLPLEYYDPAYPMRDDVGDEGAYLVHAAARRLPETYGWRGVLRALFSFDLRFAISAVGEMLLERAGVDRRTSLATMNAHGDETGHTDAKAQAYRARNAALPKLSVSKQSFEDAGYWSKVSQQLARLRARGVIVVGGLPTTFDDTEIAPEALMMLRRHYAAAGGCLLVLPNRSLYPRSYFYDASYHLTESHQRAHSSLLAPRLAAVLQAGGCPSAGIEP